MARTYSEMVPLGTEAPIFDLPAVNPGVDDRGGATRSLDDYSDRAAIVIAFICNHCPYVQTIEDRLLELAREMHPRGVQFIGICSNDPERYPDDGFEALAERTRQKNYPFPYLHDETQSVARAYDAVCTPDFFVYDADRKLVYRGRLDDGRPGQEPTTSELRDALHQLLEAGEITTEQHPSMGCNIKWKEAA
jgi:peroxiredoxin